jgi:hypothetical protein
MKWIVDRRIWIDLETKEKLDDLCETYTNRDNLLSQIICKWVCSEEKKCERGYGFRDDIIYTGCRIRRLYLNIDDFIWNNFIDICGKRELDVSSGFKTAVFYFVERESFLMSSWNSRIVF